MIVGEVVTDPAEIAAIEQMRKRLRTKKRKPKPNGRTGIGLDADEPDANHIAD